MKWQSLGAHVAYRNVVDESAFDELTPGACYFIGLLATDGCIGGSAPTRVSIKLQADDTHIISTLAEFLSTDAKVSIHPRRGGSRPQAGIQVRSARLVERLTGLGVGARKSLTMRIESDVLLNSRDFWRGVIDGDGTVMMYEEKKKDGRTYRYPRIQLVSGSETFIRQFIGFLEHLDVRHSLSTTPTESPGKGHVIYTCVVSNQEDIVRLVTLLYRGCGRYALRRKRSVADEIRRAYTDAPKRKVIVTKELEDAIIQEYERTLSSNRTASRLGVTTTTVTNVLKAAGLPIVSKSGNSRVKHYSADEILRVYSEVQSTRRTAAQLGIHRETVRKVLHENEARMVPSGRRRI